MVWTAYYNVLYVILELPIFQGQQLTSRYIGDVPVVNRKSTETLLFLAIFDDLVTKYTQRNVQLTTTI